MDFCARLHNDIVHRPGFETILNKGHMTYRNDADFQQIIVQNRFSSLWQFEFSLGWFVDRLHINILKHLVYQSNICIEMLQFKSSKSIHATLFTYRGSVHCHLQQLHFHWLSSNLHAHLYSMNHNMTIVRLVSPSVLLWRIIKNLQF